MITVFNRKELLMSYDLRQVNDLREILRANRIDYYVKAASSRTPFAMSESRVRTVIVCLADIDSVPLQTPCRAKGGCAHTAF